MAGRAEQGTFDWTTTKAPTSPPRRPTLGSDDRHRWLKADEAAAYLGLPTRKALYAAVARGQVPVHRLGPRRLRFKRDELDHLLGQVRETGGVR